MDGYNCGRLEKDWTENVRQDLKILYDKDWREGLPREINNVNENVRTEKETRMGRMTINGQ